MKKLIIILVLMASGMSLPAQNLKEVVYLKNGSIIKGIIIEQVPNESLKIQTTDGSIFVCKLSEVEKITKEAVKPVVTNLPAVVNYEEEEDDNTASGNGLKSGFRMLVETGGQYALTDDSGHSPLLNIAIGGQIGSHFFIGGGIGIRYYPSLKRKSYFALPIFANVRWDIINKRATPFIDLKGGYTPVELEGYNFSAGIGCRVRLGRKVGLSASLGVELQDYGYSYYSSSKGATSVDFFTRVGIDF
ncbi:MAG: hypothetical protein IJ537_01075 [Bacteroidaceae bacterium]|nr:hypothetical protein [Bacteroidaceae bacterium]